MAPKESQAAPAKDEKDVKTPPESGSKSKNGKKGKTETESDAILSAFRPKKRFFVSAIFFAICLGIAVFHNPCDVRKKKQDCGYSGISALECRTTQCFLKGGGELEKKKIVLKRKKGTKFGITAGSKDDSWVYINGIKDGAVADHNAKLPADSEDRIMAGDSISAIDGSSGSSLRKKLSGSDSESVSIEIRRTTLPAALRWIHSSSKVSFAEKVLTAPGFQAWFDSFHKLGGLGFSFWFMSGYPAASLPFYYLGLSAMLSWNMNRCCHDEGVAAGVPHCYKGGSAKLPVALNRIREKGEAMLAKVRKNPKGYAEWLFLMPDLKKWI